MELDALDPELAMAYAHHLPVRRSCGHLELRRHAHRGERVITAGLEVRGQPGEDPLAVVLDRGRLAVQERLGLADLAAEAPTIA